MKPLAFFIFKIVVLTLGFGSCDKENYPTYYMEDEFTDFVRFPVGSYWVYSQGKILKDEEHPMGARVTLEDKGHVAPFAITLGIYGRMFHTEFFSTADQSLKCFDLYKEKIEQVFDHVGIGERDRDNGWTIRYNQLMDELLAIS